MPRGRAITRNIVVIAVIVIVIVAAIGIVVYESQTNNGGVTTVLSPNPGGSSVTRSTASSTSSSVVRLQRSGPISTYPATWGIYSVCPGFQDTGNTSTLSNLSDITYPDGWNTTIVVTLGQIYEAIISTSGFTNAAAQNGWVVYSWSFVEGGSTNIIPNSDDIIGYFIFTNGVSPDGYLTAYYDIGNGEVAVSPLTTTVTVSCPTSPTYTIRPTQANFSVSSSSGLELEAELNTTTIKTGGAVTIKLMLFNTLNDNLSLVPNLQNSTLPTWGGYSDICGDGNDVPVVGYALFRGYYTQSNFSAAGGPLQLAPPVELPCATWSNPTSLVFFPDSDMAEVYGAGGPDTVQQITKVATTEYCTWDGAGGNCGRLGAGLFGYWTSSAPITQQQATLNSPYLTYFSPGDHTLVAEDAWGQTIYAHFLVVPGS